MGNFEEVKKKIGIWQRNPDIYLGHGKGYRKMTIDDLALQICQLFDAECQERVERIFGEIESIMPFFVMGDDMANFETAHQSTGRPTSYYELKALKYQALKKREVK